jgi:hypothetical protein
VEQVYGWCSNGTRVKRQEISLPWADANPPELNQSCLSLNLKNSQFTLNDVECAAQKHVLCEVNWSSYLPLPLTLMKKFLAYVQQSSVPSILHGKCNLITDNYTKMSTFNTTLQFLHFFTNKKYVHKSRLNVFTIFRQNISFIPYFCENVGPCIYSC